MVECELFADTYRKFGINTVRYPVVELVATVTPFDNPISFNRAAFLVTIPSLTSDQ